jgi:hypothetical protein
MIEPGRIDAASPDGPRTNDVNTASFGIDEKTIGAAAATAWASASTLAPAVAAALRASDAGS